MIKQNQSKENSSSTKRYDSGQGGFVAVLHTLEEKLYGPNSPLDAKGRVLLYLRHRALRDYETKKRVPKSEILKATGLKTTALKSALRDLEKKEHLLVTRTKVGKVWGDNIYELHPKTYGTDYIYRPEKPSFKILYGGKAHKSYVHSPGPDTDPGVGHNTDPDLGVKDDLGNGVNSSESFGNSAPKNPLKEPMERTLSENSDSHSLAAEREAAEEAKKHIENICNFGFRKMPQ